MNNINNFDKEYLNINFIVHPPFEFAYAMIDIVHEKALFSLAKEFNYTPDLETVEMIHAIRGKLSKFLLRELAYFFGFDVKYSLFTYIMHFPTLSTVTELIQTIRTMPSEEFIHLLIVYVLYENLPPADLKSMPWNNPVALGEAIEGLPWQSAETKEKLLECLENPEETQQRYVLLLNQFYEKAYKEFEERIIAQSTPYKDKYQHLFQENPARFFRDYLNIDPKTISNQTVNIHISLLEFVGSWYVDPANETLPDWVFLGAYTEQIVGLEAVKERLQKFFKIMSDGKRMDIVELLAGRPWFVNELAEELNLTPATISHHLGTLLALGIATCERDEHRVYYSLDKSKMRKIFEEGMDLLLRDSL